MKFWPLLHLYVIDNVRLVKNYSVLIFDGVFAVAPLLELQQVKQDVADHLHATQNKLRISSSHSLIAKTVFVKTARYCW